MPLSHRAFNLLHSPAVLMTLPTAPVRTGLYANPEGKFLHDVVLDACRKHGDKTAMVDTSCTPFRRITYAEYGELVERTARGFVAAGIKPGDMIGIFLPNCWEFGVAFHAATMAGAIPTTMNPTYRDREVHYQMEVSDAVALISDGPLLQGIDLTGLPALRKVYTTRSAGPGGTEPFSNLYTHVGNESLPEPKHDSRLTLATLPFSSGTTGLPKGVMLSHHNIVANVYQTLTDGETGSIGENDSVLCFLPLYHIYGLTVGLNMGLIRGCTVVLMPRFDCEASLRIAVGRGRHGHPLRAASVAGVLPCDRCGKVPSESQDPLGEVRRRPAGSRSGAPVQRFDGHSDSAGIRHDRGFACHPHGLPRSAVLSRRFDWRPGCVHGVSRTGRKRKRSPAGRTG